MTPILDRLWKILISLKFAVVVIVLLAISLAVATVIESEHDTQTAQYYVYQAAWFYVLLSVLGALILAVAISRLPWKKKHVPFLMAHAGILMVLIGSWVTAVNGVDGNIRISEGEVSSAVELNEHVLVFKKGDAVVSTPFPWIPEGVAQNFKPEAFPEYGIEVSKVIPDAEAKIDFPAADGARAKADTVAPAIQIKILGAPMGGAPEIWLWAGDAAWSTQKLGPARFVIRREDQKDLAFTDANNPEARLDFVVTKKGELRFEATSIRGEKKSAKVDLSKIGVKGADPVMINPEWRMPIQVMVRKFVPHALNTTEYVKAKQKGSMSGGGPIPAIQVRLIGTTGDQAGSALWLGLGDRADLTNSKGEAISIGYFPRRLVLPFALRLKKFEMKHNPGTMDPAAYASDVQIVQDMNSSQAQLTQLPQHHISMNEPLKHGGYTFYQASYIPDFPRPVTTVLSVNFDPGRGLKYWGSLLLVCGTILLYLLKVIQRTRSKNGKGLAAT